MVANVTSDHIIRGGITYEWSRWAYVTVSGSNSAVQIRKVRNRQCVASDNSAGTSAQCGGGSVQQTVTYVKVSTAMTWSGADTICRNSGAKLFDHWYASRAEIAEICQHFVGVSYFWTSLYSRANTNKFVDAYTGIEPGSVDWDGAQPGAESATRDRANGIHCGSRKYHDAYPNAVNWQFVCFLAT
ncbi:uncharacterized protein LOC142357161 [Convolutriloba macropyga]|uniref:uncharacterized protein LOC142357161 n=1 Tax=Convolutriloba macropyga TaxID=536237 RepID=UPI003F521918